MAYFQDSPTAQQFLYICGLVICMCLSLRNVFGTTMLTMLGPGKALRGPDGSMHSAVDGMLESFEGIIQVRHLSIYRCGPTMRLFTPRRARTRESIRREPHRMPHCTAQLHADDGRLLMGRCLNEHRLLHNALLPALLDHLHDDYPHTSGQPVVPAPLNTTRVGRFLSPDKR